MFQLKNITCSFDQAGSRLDVLRGVDLELQRGEMVALVGPSGAGKSTLLHIAGLLEPPTAGTIIVDGIDASTASEGRRTALRRQTMGFVYQFHHLLPEFSALENIVLPQMIAGVARKDAVVRGKELLAEVGLAARETHRPARLSGGEQQRVAIARALANQPKILFADEPTGNLDERTAEGVFKVLTELVRSTGLACLIATHNIELAGRMDRVVEMHEGKLRERTF